MSLGFIRTKRSGSTSFQALEPIVNENVFLYNMDGRKLFCVEAADWLNIDCSVEVLQHVVDLTKFPGKFPRKYSFYDIYQGS